MWNWRQRRFSLFRALLPSRFTLAPWSPSFYLGDSLSRGTFSSPNPLLLVKTYISQNCQVARVRLLGTSASQIPSFSRNSLSFESLIHLPQRPSISSSLLRELGKSPSESRSLLCSLAPPRVARAQPHPAAPPQNSGAARGSAAERRRVPSV